MTLLTPVPGYKVSLVFAAINVLVFAALSVMNFSFSDFSVKSIYWLGANYAPWVDQGQWWRFITSMFLHFGVMHLAFNSVSILFLGRILEPALGTLSFTIVYFVTGIAGSFASYTFNDSVFSAGASGAVFGLFGVFLALLLSNMFQKEVRDQWLKSIGAILAVNLAMGFVLPVDNAAHIGGLVSGVILGFMLVPLLKRNRNKLRN